MSKETQLARPNAVEVALGDALEWGIQRWVAWSGRKAWAAESPWLEGPVGEKHIGAEFYEAYARETGLEAVTDDEDAGLLPNFDVLAGEGFDPSLVRSEIRDFYERTATSTSAGRASRPTGRTASYSAAPPTPAGRSPVRSPSPHPGS